MTEKELITYGCLIFILLFILNAIFVEWLTNRTNRKKAKITKTTKESFDSNAFMNKIANFKF